MRIATVRIDLLTLDGVSLHDISDELGTFVSGTGIASGLCVLALGDDVCSLTITDDLEDTYEDFIRMGRDRLGARSSKKRETDDRLDDVQDTGFVAAIASDSITLPVRDGRLATGAWESIVIIDPSGPAERHIDVTVVGE